MQSIIQKDKECFVCHSTSNLEEHHIFMGNPGRKNSEKAGLKVWLCSNDHRGPKGAHFNKDLDIALKKYAQMKYEESHSREDFIKLFGKNYI